MLNDDHRLLALRLGSIFHGEINPEEIRSPGLSRNARTLLDKDPVAYGHILELLLDGQTPPQVAKSLHKDPNLVRFIARLHPEIRDAHRSSTINNLELSLVQLSQRLAQETHHFDIRDVPKAIATTTEQLALLTGHATQRVEITNVPSREKLLAMFHALQKKNNLDSDVQPE